MLTLCQHLKPRGQRPLANAFMYHEEASTHMLKTQLVCTILYFDFFFLKNYSFAAVEKKKSKWKDFFSPALRRIQLLDTFS